MAINPLKEDETLSSTPYVTSCILKKFKEPEKTNNIFMKWERKVNTVACPKCKAKIGIVNQKVATQVGIVFGIMCCICGCWIQGYPGHEEMPLEARH